MKRLKFSGFVSMVCVLGFILIFGTDIVPVALAGVTAYPSYAKLTDSTGYKIQSDTGSQYLDESLSGGEDIVEIYIDNKNKYTGSRAILGIVEYKSGRRVRFLFDLADCTRLVSENKAVLDILIWKDSSKVLRRGNEHSGKWYLDDGTPRFRVIDYITSAGNDSVAFIVDPGWDGYSLDAITQATVNSFYGGETDVYETSMYGHVIYYLDYPSGISAIGSNPTWTIEPTGSPTLYVKRLVKRGKNTFYERLNLATYTDVPFKLTLSLNSIIP